jgi:hypothetical protein
LWNSTVTGDVFGGYGGYEQTTGAATANNNRVVVVSGRNTGTIS